MIRLLAAIDDMIDVLTEAGAPRRQLDGVRDWRAEVSTAVICAGAYNKPRGMHIADERQWSIRGWVRPPHVRFLHGEATHRAWRDLCKAILDALAVQESHAAALGDYWMAKQKRVAGDKAVAFVQQQQVLAAAWQIAAFRARAHGEGLVRGEDRIARPVGKAIARAGGVTEVAADRYYHQRSAR